MTPAPIGRFFSSPKSRARCRASASVSVNEPGSRKASIRSRAVRWPLACRFSRAASEPGWRDFSTRACSSASLPAVVWMSGPSLSKRSAVTAQRLSGHTSEMYGDLDRPPLRAAALQRALDQDGYRVEVLDSTGSTNAVVAERARAGEPHGLVVIAEEQTRGRGRLDRTWVSPARAGLTFSLLVRPSGPLSWVPLLAGVGVAQAIRRRCELDAVLKWPNDVLVVDRKLCGLLAEAVDGAVVLGIGLNVTTRRDEL